MKNLILATATSLFATGAGAQSQRSEEIWLANIDSQKPYLASVVMSTAGMACKIMNGQRFYIPRKGQKLPGTDAFRLLSGEEIRSIQASPSCPQKNPNV